MQNKGQRNLVNTINKRDENKKQTDVDIRHRFFFVHDRRIFQKGE